MKKNLSNSLDVLVALAAVCVTPFAPWWAVWLICFPALFLAILALISRNLPEVWQS